MIVVLDTNTVLYYLAGKLTDQFPEGVVCVSVITEIELLSYPDLALAEAERLAAFLASINVLQLETDVKVEAIRLRRSRKLKLPDSIVAGTAIAHGGILVTNDLALSKVAGLNSLVPALSN